VLQNISNAVASSGIAFLDLAANQQAFALALTQQLAPEFAKFGLKLDSMTVQNLSLPDELQQVLDQKIGMGMVGQNMGQFLQYQTAQALGKFADGAAGGGGMASDAMGLGAGMGLGQVLAQNLAASQHAPAAASPAGVSAETLMSTLEKLAELTSKGILTADEFAAKKAELLKKLT